MASHYARIDTHEQEGEANALLPPQTPSPFTAMSDKEAGLDYQEPSSKHKYCAMTKKSLGARWIPITISTATFGAGILACLAVQSVLLPYGLFPIPSSQSPLINTAAAAVAQDEDVMASSSVFHFPPASPTNGGSYTTYFPENIGYAGPMPTGDEAGLVETAPSYPVHTGAPNLVSPSSFGGAKGSKNKGSFDIFKHWGNLSPWYSVPSADFGLPHASPEAPDQCRVTGLHFLHRHGARYPTPSNKGLGQLLNRLDQLAQNGTKWTASGDLAFLNKWSYTLGGDILTPFGRQQMYDLGVNLRIKYGFLLQGFKDALPVFRTESQDRMLRSAQNFAVGFFGYPIEGQYLQSITYEAPNINNTLAPYKSCANANVTAIARRGNQYVEQWVNTYLQKAAKRLQKGMKGMEINPSDAYNFQQLCAYETVALGYSSFCELFTEKEWEGFGYAMDLNFWYNSAFGSPIARAQGIGYVQELVARLTHTPIATHNSSTNSTLDDNPVTFPLHQPLYVDATHEVVVLNIITALNLSSLAATGPLPATHIPKDRSFKTGQLAPFGTNMQFQLLSCGGTDQIRIIVNDGVVPLTGIEGCPKDKDGLCPVDTFVAAQKKIIAETDWKWDCNGTWSVPAGTAWNTTTGDSPPKP